MNPYKEIQILSENTGNNEFSWEKRKELYKKLPSLFIPSLIEWSLDDVMIGDEIVFEEAQDGQIISCKGLKNFVRTEKTLFPEIVIFDNHNHALFFWTDAIRRWLIEPGFELIHIDEHSDLWDNSNMLDGEQAIKDAEYAWQFTNFSCNVGNYILPAIECGLVKNIIRIENEFQMDTYMNYTPPKNSVLNLDLDIFSDELEYIPEEKKMKCIKNLLKHVTFVTIATSPYFIDQWKALKKLRQIFEV